MPWWPEDEWRALLEGRGCVICTHAPLASSAHSDLIAESETSYTHLSKNQTHAGYSLVMLKRHVPELHELGPPELSRFWLDVATVGRVITELFRPVKLYSLVMGGRAPHVHCHVFPQYADDDPQADPRINEGNVRLTVREQRARVVAMRERLLAADRAEPR